MLALFATIPTIYSPNACIRQCKITQNKLHAHIHQTLDECLPDWAEKPSKLLKPLTYDPSHSRVHDALPQTVLATVPLDDVWWTHGTELARPYAEELLSEFAPMLISDEFAPMVWQVVLKKGGGGGLREGLIKFVALMRKASSFASRFASWFTLVLRFLLIWEWYELTMARLTQCPLSLPASSKAMLVMPATCICIAICSFVRMCEDVVKIV